MEKKKTTLKHSENGQKTPIFQTFYTRRELVPNYSEKDELLYSQIQLYEPQTNINTIINNLLEAGERLEDYQMRKYAQMQGFTDFDYTVACDNVHEQLDLIRFYNYQQYINQKNKLFLEEKERLKNEQSKASESSIDKKDNSEQVQPKV